MIGHRPTYVLTQEHLQVVPGVLSKSPKWLPNVVLFQKSQCPEFVPHLFDQGYLNLIIMNRKDDGWGAHSVPPQYFHSRGKLLPREKAVSGAGNVSWDWGALAEMSYCHSPEGWVGCCTAFFSTATACHWLFHLLILFPSPLFRKQNSGRCCRCGLRYCLFASFSSPLLPWILYACSFEWEAVI